MGSRGSDRACGKTPAIDIRSGVTFSIHGGRQAAVFTTMTDSQWPLWEVFVQPPKGEAHEHAGSLHAVSAEMALQNARDVYSRRGEAVSIWVVPSESITASTPDDMGPFFDPGNDKPYRHPQFYKVPRGVRV